MPDTPALVCATDGVHPVFILVGEEEARGLSPRSVATFNDLISAAMDTEAGPGGCAPCQVRHLDTVACHPMITGFVVETAAHMVAAVGIVFGCPPGEMVEGAPATPRAILDLWDLGGPPPHAPMYTHLAGLGPKECRQLAADALAVLVGYMNLARA